MSWPIAERAADMTADESRQFARLVRKLPEPVGPFLMPGTDGPVYVAADPYLPPPSRWQRVLSWSVLLARLTYEAFALAPANRRSGVKAGLTPR